MYVCMYVMLVPMLMGSRHRQKYKPCRQLMLASESQPLSRRTNSLICLKLFSLAHKHKQKKNKHVHFSCVYAYAYRFLLTLQFFFLKFA